MPNAATIPRSNTDLPGITYLCVCGILFTFTHTPTRGEWWEVLGCAVEVSSRESARARAREGERMREGVWGVLRALCQKSAVSLVGTAGGAPRRFVVITGLQLQIVFIAPQVSC